MTLPVYLTFGSCLEGNLKHLNSLASGMAVAVLLSLCCPDSLRAQNLIVSSSLVQLNGQVNGAAVTASVSLSSAPNPTTPFTASAINCVGSNWLTISPSTGNTSQAIVSLCGECPAWLSGWTIGCRNASSTWSMGARHFRSTFPMVKGSPRPAARFRKIVLQAHRIE